MVSMRTRRVRKAAVSVAVMSVVVAVVAAGAFGRAAGTSGGLTTAKGLFTTVGCSACHTFKAANATGKIGPSLDSVSLDDDADCRRRSPTEVAR